MTLEREVHADLRAMLMANEPFEYAHLIKFERPSRPDSNTGKVSTSAIRYTHLTDASRDIGYDDGSKDMNGVSNGTQTYLANKVLKVSEVSESIEAKASNFTVTLDGNGLGADTGAVPMAVTAVAGSPNMYDITVDQAVDPVYEGFREGDKIEFYGALSGEFNINGFRADNKVRIQKIDDNLVEGSYTTGFRHASEEIKSILLDKNLPEYASFINREVFIYKIYQQSGVTIGAPILLFKGIISNVTFDDSDNGIQVSWGLTSHWGDFAQVKGRISSDDFHRALDQNGNPQPASALKVEYAYDKGFMHSETSINTLAKYIVKVEKQKVKAKNGFLGIGSKVKVKKYFVNEDRFTELDLQLQARAIPLHYGVRITEGFPVFADTLNTDSSTVYIVYALGEGPIGGIYDIIVDDKSLICANKGDYDARAAQTADQTVDILCRGRADRGDVLEGQNSIDGVATPIDFYDTEPTVAITGRSGFLGALLQAFFTRQYTPPIPQPAVYNSTGKGIIDGEAIALTSPIDMSLDFYGGSSNQPASSQLVTLAFNKQFKVQNDYWLGEETDEYWGPNHRLLDTAYIVAKFKISEGETSIPSLEFIIRGKVLECYNYDYSFPHYEKAVGDAAASAFALGATVDLRRSDTDAIINAGVQIIDKWSFIRSDGTTETRFRFSSTPALNYDALGAPAIKKFYMQSGANKWTMRTYNFIEHSGIVPTELSGTIVPIDDGGNTTYPLPPTIPPTNGVLISQPENTLIGGGWISGNNLQTNYRWNVNIP